MKTHLFYWKKCINVLNGLIHPWNCNCMHCAVSRRPVACLIFKFVRISIRHRLWRDDTLGDAWCVLLMCDVLCVMLDWLFNNLSLSLSFSLCLSLSVSICLSRCLCLSLSLSIYLYFSLALANLLTFSSCYETEQSLLLKSVLGNQIQTLVLRNLTY